MSLQVQNANNVKIYTVSGSKGSRSIPDWLARRNKKALKNDLGNDSRQQGYIPMVTQFEASSLEKTILTEKDAFLVPLLE